MDRSGTRGGNSDALAGGAPAERNDVQRLLERAFEQRTPLLATLARQFRDLELAEDALQDAFEQALVQWPEEPPRNPQAWLLTAARRRALDQLRRSGTRQRHQTAVEAEIANQLARPIPGADVADPEGTLGDEVLSMLFACCHPALASEARVALMLQMVCGLRSEEIARAYLVPHATMAQRIVRAKRKIRDAGIPLQVPPAELLNDRLAEVLLSIYLIYNEGHSAARGDELLRADLCREAIRLAELVARLIPEEPEAEGLLALLWLSDARRPARIDGEGQPVRLQDQRRELWNRDAIARGARLVERALSRGRAGPYQVQAAIQALHGEAESWLATDWLQILGLYEVLEGLQPTAVVRLNRAVAQLYALGPEPALQALEAPEMEELHDYAPWHAARAEALETLRRREEAAASWQRAAALSDNLTQRSLFERRAAACG